MTGDQTIVRARNSPTELKRRSALVVDPRINQADIDYSLVPDDVDVFRYGNFCDEPVFRFGQSVSAWFVDDAVAISEIAKTKLRGEYEIDRILIDATRCSRGPAEFNRIGFDEVVDYSSLLVELPPNRDPFFA